MSVSVISQDTSLEAARVYYSTLKKLGGEKRLCMGMQLSQNLRERVEAGIGKRHPEYNEKQIREAFLRLSIGEELFRDVFPKSEIVP